MGYLTLKLNTVLSDQSYLEATVVLRDDSGNLSPGFSVTGSLWESSGYTSGKARHTRGYDSDMAGCLHEYIADAFLQLQPLIDLHLSSPEGVPMYAEANGWYFYSQPDGHDRAAKYLRVDSTELPRGLTPKEFRAFVDQQRERWAKEAAEGLQLMEKLGARY